MAELKYPDEVIKELERRRRGLPPRELEGEEECLRMGNRSYLDNDLGDKIVEKLQKRLKLNRSEVIRKAIWELAYKFKVELED